MKICLECDREYEKDTIHCPFDGSSLNYKSIDNVCVSCREQYGSDYQFCPTHGEKLVTVESIETLSHELDQNSKESFARGVCPNCGAWDNWGKSDNEYTCKSCLEIFFYSDNKLIGRKGQSKYLTEKELKESIPEYDVLSTIDKSNCDYWLEKFQKLDDASPVRRWNWPSFFFGYQRYLWKGMWKKGLLFYAAYFAIGFLSGFLGMAIGGPNAKSVAKVVLRFYFLGVLGLHIYLGFFGALDYYKFIDKFKGNVSNAKRSLFIGRVNFFLTYIGAFLYKAFLAQ